MARKGTTSKQVAAKKVAKPRSAQKKQKATKNAFLDLSEIMGVKSSHLSKTGKSASKKKGGKVVAQVAPQQEGFTYPKASPFKGLTNRASNYGEQVYGDVKEATRKGLMQWNEVCFPRDVLTYLQKNLELLN